jgi:hypothetical protein
MDFIEARGGEYISYKMDLQLGDQAISDRDLSVRPALRFVPCFSFGKAKLNSIRTNFLSPWHDPYTGGDTKKRTVVRKLIPFFYRPERWFHEVSDSRIRTGRKIIRTHKNKG